MFVSIWFQWHFHVRKYVPQLEVLAALQRQLSLGLASSALQTEHNLLGGLSLLVEDGLGLTTVTALLPVVTTLSLSEQRGLKITNCHEYMSDQVIPSWRVVPGGIYLSSLVLGDLVLRVLAALLGLAVRPAGFGNVDLMEA